MKLTSNEKSIALVNNFLNENTNHSEILDILKKDPNSRKAKKYGKSLRMF